MAEVTERDETPVEVTTKVDRIYRAQDSDRQAITVKAGVPTTVPAWVAESWGIHPSQKDKAPPDAPKPSATVVTGKRTSKDS